MRFPAAAIAALALALASSALADTGLSEKLAKLSPPEKAFIEDSATLKDFGLTKDKLLTAFEGKDLAGIKAVIADLVATVEANKFQPGAEATPEGDEMNPVGDMAAIPLNPTAPDFNASTVLRPDIFDEFHRDPGPLSLHRYVNEADPIPTFGSASVAVRKADLIAGKVDVAFVGVPQSLSSGWRDSQNAPTTLRNTGGLAGYDVYAGIDPMLALNVVDYGDLSVDRMVGEMADGHVRAMVAEMADAKVIPFVVGGDHSVLYPTVAGLADIYGKGKVGVVNLDAHHDAQRDLAHFSSDEQSVSRLLREGLVPGKGVIEVGLRAEGMKAEDFTWMRDQGITYHSMAEITSKGWDGVVSATLAEAASGPANVVVAFDISVLDPAYASGAGRPAADGLTMREAVPMVRRLCAETNVVGFALLDVAPYLDLSYVTALNANTIMHACLTGIAMRKTGIKDSNYLSPLTISSK